MKKITLMLLLCMSTYLSYAQVNSYSFAQTSSTYNEITGGTLLGSETSDAQKFLDPTVPLGSSIVTGVGLPIGFDFTYNGYTYDRFGVCNDGWISFGSSVFTPSVNMTSTSSSAPLSSTSLVAQEELATKICGLAKDLQGQPGSTLRIETVGTAPNRTVVIQWKNYRKYNATGDSFNFQIRLNETSNTIDFVYGTFISNSAANANYHVGLRAAPATTAVNFTSRTSTIGWGVTTPSLVAANSVLMSDVLTPSNGLMFTWTPPACGGAGALVASAITTTGATLAWSAALPSPVGYEYIVTSSTTFPVGSGTPTTISTETVSGLNPNTLYNFFLRSNCGTGFTTWILAGNFKTKCLDADFIIENFDTYPATSTSMADCWAKAGTGSAYIVSAGAAPGSVPNRLYMYAIGNGTTPTVAYAILPAVTNLAAGTHRLKFEAYATATLRFLDIGYLTDTSDISTFVLIQTVALPSTVATSALEFISIPTGIPAGVKNLAFRNVGIPTGSTSLYIDDVVWEPNPTCPDVTAIVANNMTSTTVNVAWAAGGTETAWQYVVGTSTVTNPNTLTPVDVTSATTTIPGLSPSIAYKVWVRSNCGTTSLGAWIGPIIVTTTCAYITDFTQNFDLATTFPACWSKVGTTGNVSIINSITTTSLPNHLSLGSNTTVGMGVVVMQPVSNSGAGTHRLKFKFRGSVVGTVLEVGYLTDISNASSFVALQSYTSTSATVYDNINAILGTLPTTPFLAFRNPATGTGNTDYIDDVIWEPIPTCPDISNLASTGTTSTTADVNWLAGGSETAWQYAYGATTVTDPNTLTPVDVTSVLITVPGLAPSLSYKMWVRSYCGATSIGAWIGPITFTTTCAPVTAFTQNFDSGTTFIDCWSKVGTTGAATIAASTTAASQPNYLSMSSSSAINTAVVAMKPVSNAGAGTHRLKFKFRGSVVGATLEVGYLTNISDAASFIPLQSYLATSTTVYDNIVTELGTDPLTQILAFRKLFTTSSTVYIDDVVWEPIPTCLDISALSINSSTSTTADATWLAGSTETAWQYALGATTVTDPNTLTPVDVTSTAITIPGLTPSVSYKMWVRSYCGATSIGAWIGPVTFSTTCAPVTTFTQNFDSGTIFTDCWSKVGTTGTATIVASTTAPSQPNYLNMNSSSATNMAVVAMKPVSNASAGTHRLKFKFRGSVVGATLEVGYLTNISDAASFIPLQSYLASSTTVYDIVNAELGTEPGSQVLAFRKLFTTSSSVYIDDVVWEPIPTCPDVTAMTVDGVTSSTVDVTWLAGGTETAWQYVKGDTTVTDPNTLIPVDVTSASVTVPGLMALTSYKMWVRSYCNTTSIGAWVGPITFTTTCAPVTEFTQNFDSGTTFAACWSKVGTLGSAYPTSTTGAPSPNNTLYMSGTTAIPAVVAMQPASNTGAGTHRLKFKFRGSLVGATLEVGYLDNPSDANSFQSLQSYAATSTTVYDVISAELGTVPLSQVLAFRKGGTSSGVYIDDVSWDLIPTTVPSCATAITAVPNATCGNFATAISWAAALGADGYKLTVGTTVGGTEVLNNQNIGGGLSYSFAGNFNTTYYYKITPFNSFGEAIGCTEQSFVTAVNGCVCTSLPTSNDGTGITNILLDTTNFPNGDVMYANFTTTPVSLPQALTANLQLSFNTLTLNYHTNVWVDFNDNLTFEPTEIVFTGVSATTSPNVLNASFLVPATAPLGAHRMRIVATDVQQTPANPCYSGTYGVTLDFSIVVIAPPTCLPISGLTVNSYTSSTASISWLAPSQVPANGYDYYYSTTNTAPIATTTPSGSVGAGITTASLSVLTPATVYYVWVRSVCSTTDLSQWSPSVTFATACVSAIAPYSQNFETATVPAMPLCSITQNAGTGNNWTTAANPGYGFTSKVLRYQYNGLNAANAWYYTQPISLTAGTSYDISYKYGNNSTTYIEKLKVAYGTSASAAAMTNVLADYPSVTGAVAATATVSFTPTVSGDYYFGFNAYSIANQSSLYVDDILVQATLATNTFDNNGFIYFPNPVKDILNLGYNKEITNVTVFNLLGQQVITKSVNANQSQIDMSNLSKGTYMVKVTADNQLKTIKVIKE